MKTKSFCLDSTINVVDAMCGAGKTSWAIQKINDEKIGFGTEEKLGKKYIYVTPYLNEVERVRSATGAEFLEPEAMKGKGSKLNHLKALITLEKSIVTTHALFKKLDLETLNLIEESGYTLIMDEVANVLEQYHITKSDIDLLITKGTIAIGEKGKIQWLDDSYDGEFSDMKVLAQSDNLILQNGTAVFWTMNTRAFEAFEEVYILTYLFDGQTQFYYYQMNDINFDKYSVTNVNGRFELIDYDSNIEPRKETYNKLNVHEDKSNGNGRSSTLNSNYDSREKLTPQQRKSLLSSTWFKNASDDELKQISNNLNNYFRKIHPTDNDKLFWSTLLIAAPDLKNAKCKFHKKGDRTKDNFVSLNTRATNYYADRTSMAYVYNRFINPIESNFFKEYGITVNEDLLALSDLIQFIFRGCIRNDEPMNCYIPSERMRQLLKDWSEYKI
ncbi:hypothetical protein NYE67_10880 [Solibacillus sp. FSL W8-0474]|uniref:hypothetical protein n=1 Tax=Solibacillus sp. FSL W8-0474 TaxID=2975336 RepID=UPI0030FC1EFC